MNYKIYNEQASLLRFKKDKPKKKKTTGDIQIPKRDRKKDRERTKNLKKKGIKLDID